MTGTNNGTGADARDPDQVLPPEHKRRGPKLEPHTLDAIARMIVTGAPTSLISASVGLPEAEIRRALESNSELRERVLVVRGQVFKAQVMHHYEMMALLPEVRNVFAASLRSQDERLKLDSAKFLHDSIMPKPVQRQETEHTHNLNGGGVVPPEVTAAFSKIGDALGKIAEAQAGRPSFEDRVKQGPEALPRVAPQAPEPSPAELPTGTDA